MKWYFDVGQGTSMQNFGAHIWKMYCAFINSYHTCTSESYLIHVSQCRNINLNVPIVTNS